MKLKLAFFFIIATSYGGCVLAKTADPPDVVVYLRASDHGPFGAILRAGKKAGGVSRTQCANITPLVNADNGIWDPTRLQVGMRIVVKGKYLKRGFRPSKEVIRVAHEIFPPAPTEAAVSPPPSTSVKPAEQAGQAPCDLNLTIFQSFPQGSPTPQPAAPRAETGKDIARSLILVAVYLPAGFMLCVFKFRNKIISGPTVK